MFQRRVFLVAAFWAVRTGSEETGYGQMATHPLWRDIVERTVLEDALEPRRSRGLVSRHKHNTMFPAQVFDNICLRFESEVDGGTCMARCTVCVRVRPNCMRRRVAPASAGLQPLPPGWVPLLVAGARVHDPSCPTRRHAHPKGRGDRLAATGAPPAGLLRGAGARGAPDWAQRLVGRGHMGPGRPRRPRQRPRPPRPAVRAPARRGATGAEAARPSLAPLRGLQVCRSAPRLPLRRPLMRFHCSGVSGGGFSGGQLGSVRGRGGSELALGQWGHAPLPGLPRGAGGLVPQRPLACPGRLQQPRRRGRARG